MVVSKFIPWIAGMCFHPGGGYESVTPVFLHKTRYRALNWTHQLRSEDQPTRKWGPDVSRIAVALYLSNDSDFRENRTIRDEISYELSLGLLSRLALKKIEDISSTELAHYINAFLVTCIDPRKFHVLDLVSELRKRVDAQNYTNPSVILALCNAGERITERDVEKLIGVFWKAHREFWTDTQALAVLALACAAKQPHEVFDMVEINELTMELKKQQYRNGTVENLKTTALVLQALFASEREADEENFDEEKALKQILRSQKENGSFGNVPNTYYVLPVLRCRSLVNISSSHCKAPVIDAIHENDSLSEVSKFNYLKAHLGGSALSTVEGFALTPENYEIAIKLLKERFGRSDVLINTHLNNLLRICPLKNSDDIVSFRKMFDNIQTEIRSLESLNVLKETSKSSLPPPAKMPSPRSSFRI
ncbi:hypothetical protein AVEN_271495-1 [Araneus ventricosus]|uniref:Uncharacterized protein n=2 Tax=Araneus ventricosus TaxID=182803 RepID=A0A4Y2ID39_ARAVE|nr:hypothetical protein AVEN_271495-1 [Araneus ventricosus]